MTRLASVVPSRKPFTLRLRWQDGSEQMADLSGLVTASRHFRCFLDQPSTFKAVSVINWGHGIAWENGLDYSAENLRHLADEQADRRRPGDLDAFKEKFGLTNEQLGAVLGYRKSQIKNFKAGHQMPDAARIALRAMTKDPVILYARLAKTGVAAMALQKAGRGGKGGRAKRPASV